MAGAVSAGAYTAGVMDYLIEALNAWEQKKKEDPANTPSHKIIIPALGGASAGGMTAMITAAALNTDITPVRPPLNNIMQEHPENKLYHSWVDLTGNDMFQKMLDTSDLQSGEITSLLNSTFIDSVADRAISSHGNNFKPLPSFIDPDLKIFTTLTNLNGFPFNVGMKTEKKDTGKYYMNVHNDYACFKLHNPALPAEEDPMEDGWMVLDFKTGKGLQTAKEAAMATGAFPVGLKSRKLSRTATHVNTMKWCIVTKHFKQERDPCVTLNVDGGVINNEPFEKVQEIVLDLSSKGKEAIIESNVRWYENENTFGGTVLMIDPFPSKKPDEFNASQSLGNVVGLTFGAMLEQMRAKPELLADAMDKENHGQFLIAPSRERKNLQTGKMEDIAGDQAIACGALGGFSGFMNKEFRVHDYILGRLNCESFLRNHFTVSEEALTNNPIFKNGYGGVDKNRFKAKDGSYQIIPIFSASPPQGYFPMPTFSSGTDWPYQKESSIESFRSHVKRRVKILTDKAIKTTGLTRILLSIGKWVILNKMATNAAMNAIKDGLEKHQLLERNR